MTKEQIQEQYALLCKEVGDLYFQLSFAESQLKGLQDRMAAMKARRDELHTAFQAAPSAAPSTPAPEAADVAPAVDAPAG